jgi:hypothetical protein
MARSFRSATSGACSPRRRSAGCRSGSARGSRLRPPSTEAFTWTTSALLAGVGIGLAAGGALLEVFPSQAALATGAAAALVAAAGARWGLGG